MTTDVPRTRTISLIRESDFALDGGAMFGIIPRPLWSKSHPPDAQNRIDMTARCVVIKDPDQTILIDTGMGSEWTEKEREIYRIQRQDHRLVVGLAEVGVTPADVDHVILTHLHFDHAGGLVTRGTQGKIAATFPNATHWVQRRNWSWAWSPSARDGGSYRRETFSFLEEDGAPTLRLIDGVDEILPGIEVLPCHGHTFGMQVIKIACADATYLFLADLVPTSAHLRAPYVMGYDLQPLVTVEEKQEFLYHARRRDWVLIFEHDASTATGIVELDSRGRPSLIPLHAHPASLTAAPGVP